MFSAVLIALTSALAVVAQTNHTVVVGADGGLTFTPDNVNAQANDIINFVFVSKNHTVTQSTFGNPCTFKPDGIDSGYVPAAEASEGNALSFAFRVRDAEPLWFYCKQGPHCVNGMVFAVNPTAEQPMTQFVANAKESAPADGGAPGGGAPAPGGDAPAGDAPTGGAPSDPNGGSAPLPGTDAAGGGTTPEGQAPGAESAAIRLGSGAATIMAVVGVVASLL